MTEYKNRTFTGERALYASQDVAISDCVFEDGESPLKESRGITLKNSEFRWKYPLWYCENVTAEGCTWREIARAGVWYTNHISVKDALIIAPKNFRRCTDLTLENVEFTDAAETLWSNRDVKLKNVTAKGDYFAMNCENIEVDGLNLDGNYSFDGCRNITVRNSRLMSKDAFWNCENVTVYDSYIVGEYLGWNSKNLTLINCTIESLQGMCYIENLVMRGCKTAETTLAFEYSTVDAEIEGDIESILNPASGRIKADSIGELIVEEDDARVTGTEIICDSIGKKSDRPEWK